MVDVANRLGAMRRIALPLACPGIVTGAINNYIDQYSIDWGHLFAGSVIATIPVIILFAVIEGRVVSGLTAGSIK